MDKCGTYFKCQGIKANNHDEEWSFDVQVLGIDILIKSVLNIAS